MSNSITVRGHVGTHPQIIVTPTGRQLVKFRLGSTRGFRDKVSGEWRDHPTDWFTVEVWGERGINLDQSLRVGVPLIVQGTFQCQEWTSEDRQGFTNVINADTVAIDLRSGRATYTKIIREESVDDRAGEDQSDGASSAAGEDTSSPELSPEPAPNLVDPDQWEKVDA